MSADSGLIVTGSETPKLGLEFAPGTSPDYERLVVSMFTPQDILGSYRAARVTFKTGDIVLVAAEHDLSGFDAQPRMEYVRKIRAGMGLKAPALMRVLTIAHQSAHQMMKLPISSEAMWLVINRAGQVPAMGVVYVAPYATEALH